MTASPARFRTVTDWLPCPSPRYALHISFLPVGQTTRLEIFVWGAIGPYGTVWWIELAAQTGLVEWAIAVALLGPVLLEAAVSHFAIDWIIKRALWASAGSIALNPGAGFFVALVSGSISIASAVFREVAKACQKEPTGVPRILLQSNRLV